MCIILTSNGLTSSSIIDEYKQLFLNGYKSVAIVVTADPIYREKDVKAISSMNIFKSIGFNVRFFDIDYDEPIKLFDYDIIYFIGGNPFYLLHSIRKTKTDIILKKCLHENKVISGASAGSIVLGETIILVNEFDSQLNKEVGVNDLSGVKLTNINICPHYSRFQNKYDNFEKRIYAIEKSNNIDITRINDGEAIIIKRDLVKKI
jgi:dipeptidase E